MDFEVFHFLRPWWLLALVPCLAVVWLWIRRTQSGSGWETAIDSELLHVLLDPGARGSNRWLRNLLMFGVVIAVVGMSGPTWQKLPQSVEQKNDALVILLDLSLSMLAEDVKPSRIERARQKITDILRLREEGLTALIVYAGDAHAVVPLTDDTATIENLLVALGPEMMPVPGSNPDHGLQLATELFANSQLQQGRILMITDGIDSINSVSKHRHQAYPISIIGIGTQTGGPIPLDRLNQPGKVLLTQEGNRIIALLDHQRLQDVADLTFGIYAPAVLGDNDILRALNTTLPGEDETLDVEREFDTWYDQGYWLALVIAPLLLLIFRKGVVLCIPLVLCLLPLSTDKAYAAQSAPGSNHSTDSAQAVNPAATPAPPPPQQVQQTPGGQTTAVPDEATLQISNPLTDLWEALWYNDNQRGQRAMRYGQPEKAVVLFEDPKWQAAARYRSGDYAGALNGFAADNSTTGTYNQGNALARIGEYEAAIGQYAKVLQQDPNHEDAAFNKALVEKLLEEKQNAEQQQNQDQQNQANNEESDSEQDQQQQEQEESEQDQQSDESEQNQQDSEQQEESEESTEQQQAQQQEDEQARDEKQEALEQWLRRVPDDPGGLLKRKFSHETKQRMRRGEYDNRQSDKIW